MEGILKNAHTAFTAHKATSHANTTGQRKKGWSAWGVREKKTHLGGGCSVDPWLAPLPWDEGDEEDEGEDDEDDDEEEDETDGEVVEHAVVPLAPPRELLFAVKR